MMPRTGIRRGPVERARFPVESFSSILDTAAAHPILQACAIVIGTFILEDAATVLVGVAAASGTVSVGVAISSLYVGIMAGDIGLYALGRIAARFSWAARYVQHEMVNKLRNWVDRRLVRTVMVTRFVPSMRLPTYTACGYLGLHLGRFTASVVAATMIWTTLLFGAAFHFGAITSAWLGFWRWPCALLLVVVLIIVGRALTRRYQPDLRPDGADPEAGIREDART